MPFSPKLGDAEMSLDENGNLPSLFSPFLGTCKFLWSCHCYPTIFLSQHYVVSWVLKIFCFRETVSRLTESSTLIKMSGFTFCLFFLSNHFLIIFAL
jgi:hypothetical protein